MWVTVIILVPIMLVFAMILPHNTVLPFAGIINLSFVNAALLLTGANLLRMITLGIITTPIFLYGATYFAPVITNLAKSTGTVKVQAGQQLSWSTFEGPDFRLFFAQAFNGQWWAIALAVLWTLGFIWLYRDQIKIKLPSQRYGALAPVTAAAAPTAPASTSSDATDVDLSDLSGLDFSDAKASNESKKAAKDKQNDTTDDVDLNDISGLDFSQTSHDKKRGDKGE